MAITRRRKAARKLRGVKKKRGRHTYKKEMDRPTQGFGLGLGFRFGFAHMCCQTQGCQAKLSAWAYTIYVCVGYTLTNLPPKGGCHGLVGAWHIRQTVARRTSKLSKTAAVAADPKRQKMLPQLSKRNFCEIERGRYNVDYIRTNLKRKCQPGTTTTTNTTAVICVFWPW